MEKNIGLILCQFQKNIFHEKIVILKKHSFHGRTLVSWSKPGLYIQRLQFFFFEYYELGIKGKHLCQRLFLMKTLLKTLLMKTLFK